MSVFFVLVRRELGGVFKSLTGYLVIAVMLLLLGFSLLDLVTKLNGVANDAPVSQMFYQSAYFWLILLPITPVITMRSFAAEKASGTYEALMTTPVGDGQVVLAKFTGALLFYLLNWLPLLGVLGVLRQVTHEPEFLEPRATAGAFLGLTLIGSLYLAMGCLASALTRSQIVAAVLSFLMGVGLWVIGLRPRVADPAQGLLGRVFDHLSLMRHMDDFARGVIDSRHLVFYLSGTVLFLFLTTRVVEARRWQ
jgi:ABC-2 type transport system permease protein